MPTAGSTPAAAGRDGGHRLPESVLTGLREAFAAELAERLPRLRAAASGDDPGQLADALRDVHTLGSSAYVVGADGAARMARAAEAALLDRRLEQFRVHVAELTAALTGWAP